MKFLASLRSLCSALFHSEHIDDEMDEEMRLHIQNRADDLERSGLSREEAERRARIEFGGVERFKEEVRETAWVTHLDSLFRDFQYAIRNLRKDRRFVAAAIFALALGIGAATVVFSVFYNLLFNAVAAKEAGRLVVPVRQDLDKAGDMGWDAGALYCRLSDLDSIRQQNHVFEDIVGYDGGVVQLRDSAGTYQLNVAPVTADAFEFYGVSPLLGRGITPEDGKPEAAPVFVMSYKTWKGEFNADPQILGKSYTIDGEPRTLVGVMPARFQAYGRLRDIWVPIPWTSGTTRSDQESSLALLARLKPGVSVESASAELDVIVKRLAAAHPDDYPKRFRARVLSANEYLMGPSGYGAVFHSDIQLKNILYDLLAAVLMLLLIACSNVANLLLARATVREKEMAVRAVLGASRGRLVRQLLMESSVLAVTACLAGCAMAWFGMKGVETIVHQKAWANIGAETVFGLNAPVLLFALTATALTTLLCGLVPALRAGRVDLQPQLVGNGKGTSAGLRHGKFRAGLVVAQVALSIVLLVGAGLMMRSLYQLTHVDMGFNPKNILVVAFAPPRGHSGLPDRAKMASQEGQALIQKDVERLKELPGVAAVAVNNTIPGYGPNHGPQVTVPGGTRVEEAGLSECDENCVNTLGMRMIAGRWLSTGDVRTDQYVAVVNQRLARDMFGDGNPLGRQIQVKAFTQFRSRGSRWAGKKPPDPPQDAVFQIVGVVADVKNSGPQQPAVPMAFIAPLATGAFILQVRTNVEPASMIHAVQEQIWAVDRDEIFWILDPLEDFLEQHTYAVPEFGVALSGPLAGVALLLVMVGVFSVMAYTVSLQTQEFGIRMALGAQRGDVLGIVLRKGFALLVSGILVGVLASYGLTRFLASQIWGVSATDPWTFGGVVALVVITGLAACLLPARRAARVDPLVALRYE
jgi:putative ABC transport system permease protein